MNCCSHNQGLQSIFNDEAARAELKDYWKKGLAKHPVMAGREADVQETLRDPDEIRRSRSDPQVLLFYKSERRARWVCAVARRTDGTGFLITAYPTDAVKEGEQIWHR